MLFVSSVELATLGQQEKPHCIHTDTHRHTQIHTDTHTHTASVLAFSHSPLFKSSDSMEICWMTQGTQTRAL